MGSKESVHMCVCGGGRVRYLHFGNNKMTVNQKGNILEFNKAEIILIQGFCRLKCPHPTVFLIPLKFSELSVPLYSASRIQVY